MLTRNAVAIHAAFGEGHQAIFSGFLKKHIKIRKKHDSVLHQKQNWPIPPTKFKGLHSDLIWICTKVKKRRQHFEVWYLHDTHFARSSYAQCKVDIVLLLCNLTSLRAELVKVWGGFLLVTFFFGWWKKRDPLSWLSDLQIGNQKVKKAELHWITMWSVYCKMSSEKTVFFIVLACSHGSRGNAMRYRTGKPHTFNLQSNVD